jgi:hypothetical protein
MEGATGELIVVRFSPFSVDGLIRAAEDDHAIRVSKGLSGDYSVSSFAKRSSEGSSPDDLIEAICREAPCSGKMVAVVLESELQAVGFSVRETEREMEAGHDHVDIVLGNNLIPADVERLSALLSSKKRRNPAWKK